MDAERWTVDFWLDPACPLTWLTARWIRAVAEHRPLEVRWRTMSLSILNEDKEVDPEGDEDGYLWIPARICAAVQTEHGHEAVGSFHRALWTTPEGDTREWIDDPKQALARAGLPQHLAEAGWDADSDHALRSSHEEAMRSVEGDVGTPVLALTGPQPTGREPRRAFFGPVVDTAPDQRDALRLWEGVLLLSGVPNFRELKR
ncbi:mycothiol-dependent nitroreductase Rv2466c family protein [Nocardiopsis metallicus]|uniref:2-hydroxychromene-2-carboxylate isomerase n=1 Tax=Nocardiopsis metallicus TaxID=179819 RepID=A0A840VYP0_9ACTN|nr:disulfide bond formation protein DsbA [Nocardiopsis metallicus]MBB5488932.1 2-hydroxychromene-2-carboxylate isomerase [Nocardiopsis metallicus]